MTISQLTFRVLFLVSVTLPFFYDCALPLTQTEEVHSDASTQDSVKTESREEKAQEPNAQEPLRDLGPDEAHVEPTPEPQPESKREQIVEPVREQVAESSREHPVEKGLPEGKSEAQQERLVEHYVETPPERQPETAPPLQAKAISILTSFLQRSPQSGLMERVNGRYQWEGIAPKGTHTFTFTLDGKSTQLGATTSSTLPASGGLTQHAPFSLTFGRPTRIQVEVIPATRRFTMKEVPAPTSVDISGSWNGQSNQVLTLTKNSKGHFSAKLALKKGPISWSFVLKHMGTTTQYGSKYPPHGGFPVGGVVHKAGQPLKAMIDRDMEVQWTYRPLEHAYTLRGPPIDAMALYNQLLANLKTLTTTQQKNDALLRFFETLKAHRQLPIVQGNQVVFLLWWKMTGNTYVSGDFNSWSTNALKMTHEAGTDFYHAKTTLTQRTEYKFVDSATTPNWRTDPYNPRFAYAQFGPNSVVNPAGSKKSHLEHWKSFAATTLKNTRDIWVYLPPGYKDTATRYPVLYMHDGQNLFDPKAIWGGWDVANTFDGLLTAQKVQPWIIVGVANTPGRMDEYTQTQDIISGNTVGGKSQQYADFLIKDLKPWIDGMYRTLPGKRATAAMGSSLGGLVSMWLGETYSDVFFRIGALSSTFGWGTIGAKNPTLLDTIKQSPFRNMVVYLDSGSPQDNYQVTLQMRDILQQKEYLPELNVKHWTQTGASHNEQAWKQRLFRPLTFLLSWPTPETHSP